MPFAILITAYATMALTGQRVAIRISLDGELRVLAGEQCVAIHRLRPAAAGWGRQPEHHAALWHAVRVEQRPLDVYEEVSTWN